MTVRYHPDPSTLASFAAGALPQAIAILVAAHAEMCPACRREMSLVGAMAGATLACAPAADIAPDAFARLSAQLDAPAPSTARAVETPEADLPVALARLVGGGLDAIPWQEVLPGVEHCRYVLKSPRGETSLRLLRAAPGSEIPDHTHTGQEATLILRGQLGDGARVYEPGEFCDLDDTTTHNPKAQGQETCVCAIAEEGPPRFTSEEVATFLRQAGI